MKNIILLGYVLAVLSTSFSPFYSLTKQLDFASDHTENEEAQSVFNYNATKEDVTFNNLLNVYLFWGDGCPFCEKEIAFLKENEEKLKGKINLYAFEVWHNEENQAMLQEVKRKLNNSATGIPFLVFNDNITVGFNESFQNELLTEILKANKTRDIIEEII